MNFAVKTIISSLTLLLISAALPTAATAAPNKKAITLNCKSSNAKGHSIKNIEIPQVKSFQKNRQITLVTNCGDVVIEADPKQAHCHCCCDFSTCKGWFF